MSGRYACLIVPSFPVAALRHSPHDSSKPSVADSALLDLALSLSPRVEDGGAGRVCLDLEGLNGLHPDERRLAEDLAERAKGIGLAASVAIASTRTAAWVAALTTPLTVVPRGHEAAFLAAFPVDVLHPPEGIASVLARWGIRTLGELASLPDAALIERLGEDGRRLQRRAQGEDLDPFIPYRPPSVVEEGADLDWPIETVDALAFVVSGILDRLVTRLTCRGWALGAVRLALGLADRSSKDYALALASPLSEGRAVLPLLLQQVRSSPPEAPVERITVRADPAAARVSQSGLFSASRVSPEQWAATLVRLEALVGREGVGSPMPLDLHRPDAFTMRPFGETQRGTEASPAVSAGAISPSAPVLRRCRPPREIDVETSLDGVPSRILGGPWAGRLRTISGPWRISGDWWTDAAWRREEWDAELQGGRVVRMVFDLTRRAWRIEGVYD
jgi:protein ImuB